MPFDSQGNFTRVMNWQEDAANSVPIVASRHDDEDDNFAQGFNNTLCRDGRAAMTGALKMGNFKITGLGNGTTNNDAINKGQLDSVQTTLNSSITNLSNNTVKITGNQSIAGTKTFTDNIFTADMLPKGLITLGTSTNTWGQQIQFRDTADKRIARVQPMAKDTTNNKIGLYVNNADNSAEYGLEIHSDGYAVAPTPATSDNSTKIATTAYVKAQSYALDNTVVKLSGNQTIAGTKTFSSSPIVPTQSTSDDSTKAANTAYVHDVLEALYPVGSIYIGTQDTCPLSSLISGSTWTKIAGDKVLQSSSSSHAANTTINAGLPNITGTVASSWSNDTNTTGAFKNKGYDTSENWGGDSGWRNARWSDFNASRSSSIYGNSSTVQPPAYVVNVWRRTA